MGLLSGGGGAAFKSVDRTNFTATAGQTTFTLTQGYSVGDIDVFLNGIKLVEGDDFFATDGTTVVLSSAASVNDFCQVVAYKPFLSANTYTKSEADSRYMVATGQTPMQSYLRAPNYGVSSYSDTATASLEASVGAGTNGVGIKAWGRSVSGSGGELTYITDTRGASGQHIWYGYNGTSLSQLMRIDTSGRLVLPSQPAFRGYLPTAADGASYVTFGATDSAFSGRNSNFNASTGIFTAPVAGVYVFTYCLMHGNGGSTSYARTLWKINGAHSTQYGDTLQDFSGSYRSTSQSMAFRLAVGDTVGIYNEGRKVYDTSYGSFSGYFLG